MADEQKIDPHAAVEFARRVREAVVTERPRHGLRDLAILLGLVVLVAVTLIVII